MNYEIKMMEGLRKWRLVNDIGSLYSSRYYPGQPLFTYQNGGPAGNRTTLADITLEGIKYRCLTMNNAYNYGNGVLFVWNTIPNPTDVKKRIYFGLRLCVATPMIQNAGWMTLLLGTASVPSITLPGIPSGSGTWYYEFVLDRVKNVLEMYRNGVFIQRWTVNGNGGLAHLRGIQIGSPPDDRNFWGKTWGATDVYVAHDEADPENPEEGYNIHGPVIIEETEVSAFRGPGWKPSDVNDIPVDVLNLETMTGAPNEKFIMSPYDGTPCEISFKEIPDGDIRGVCVQIHSKRGTSSTGKMRLECGNKDFVDKVPNQVVIPPFNNLPSVGNHTFTMATDFKGRQWTADTVKEIRLRCTSIPEMSKEK